jgi:hypothetical protein
MALLPSTNNARRTIAIGDVHGCANEFQELLEKLHLRQGDRVIQLGDLINRGPDSHRSLELARAYKIEAIIGNHELRILTAHEQNTPKILKDYDLETIQQLTKKDWEYLKLLPNSIHDRASDTIFVHAGFVPDRPWQTQPLEVITQIQVVDKNGNAAKRSDCADGLPWADTWEGEPFAVYGHTPRPKVLKRPNSIGIDTGCVYGGHLTAYIIETQSIVQVRAHKAYAHSKRLPDPI